MPFKIKLQLAQITESSTNSSTKAATKAAARPPPNTGGPNPMIQYQAGI